MGIRDGVREWLGGIDRSLKPKIVLVFHTSCVRFHDDDLNYLENTGISWCVPDDVRVELELLVQNGREYGDNAFSRRAKRILDNACRCNLRGCIGESGPWDLEQLYIGQGKRYSVDRNLFKNRHLLFLFGDRYKMYEFLEHGRDLQGHYVLVLREGEWSCAEGRVADLSREHERLRKWAMAFWAGCECKAVELQYRECEPEKLRRIKSYSCNDDGRPAGLGIPFRWLGGQIGKGSYAVICRSVNALGGEFVKIYKSVDPVGNGLGKLRSLVSGAESVAHLPLAMPQRMLMSENWPGRALGYTMKKLEGHPASRIAYDGWPDGVDSQVILRRIGALLVEVHVRSMLVNDLSFNNVLVSDREQVGFVDCDSFQCHEYAGGLMTYQYRHRDLTENDCKMRLRKPIHEYFAFTVLLYQLAMGVTNPLDVLKKENCGCRDWQNATFPLEWDTVVSDSVGEEVMKRWGAQDEATRKLFADVFHFRRSPSIGAILRDLKLL